MARHPLEMLCTTPCTTIAAETGRMTASTPIRMSPPAMPNTPEMKAVPSTLTRRMMGAKMPVMVQGRKRAPYQAPAFFAKSQAASAMGSTAAPISIARALEALP